MKNKVFLGLLALILIPFVSFSQKNLTGKIIENRSGKAIQDVLIYSGEEFETSDENGKFEIKTDSKELMIKKFGYQTLYIDLDVEKQSQLLINLEPRNFILGEIIIEESNAYSIAQSDEIMNNIKMRSQSMDAGDLIRGVNGFGVSKRGSYAQEPVFRSFRQEQINILFDGFIQYNHSCPNRMDPAVTHVIPEEIKKVEIIKGPYSVRYGPSMGATLNYLTESAKDGKDGFSGNVEAGYQTNGQGRNISSSLAYKAKAFDIYVNGSIRGQDSLLSGDSQKIPASYDSKDYGVKIGINPANNQRLDLTWKQSFLRDAEYAGLAMDARKDDSDMIALSYRMWDISPKLKSIDLKAYGNKVDHVMDNDKRDNYAAVEAVSIVDANTFGANLEINLMPLKNDMLYAGIDFKSLQRDGYRDRLVKKNMMTMEDLPTPKEFRDSIWQNSSQNVLGIYLENKYYPKNKLTLTTGVRADVVNSKIEDPAKDFSLLYNLDPRTEVNVSGNISLSYRAQKDLSMLISLGRGSRSATIDERYINHFAVGKDPYELVGNPDLKAEINNQVDFSVRKKNENYDLNLNIFYSYFNNLITASVDSSLKRKYLPFKEPKVAKRFVNVDKSYQAGMEISASYFFTKYFELRAQYAYTYAQNLSWDEPISRVPPMEGGLRISYDRENWWASFDSRFVAEQNRVAESFGEVETPGFSLFDFRAGIRPMKNMVIGVSVENILNENYVEFLNWSFNPLIGEGLIFEPGRNFSFYLKYSF